MSVSAISTKSNDACLDAMTSPMQVLADVREVGGTGIGGLRERLRALFACALDAATPLRFLCSA